jgi:hypothetical protein
MIRDTHCLEACSSPYAMSRRLLLLALAVATAPACGDGSYADAGPAPAPQDPAWVRIGNPADGQVGVAYTAGPADACVSVSGTSFVSPTWWGIGGPSGGTAGVTVTWTNQTTGATGTATCFAVVTSFGFLGAYVSGNNWTAGVPVAPGLNSIRVVASDPSGLTASDTSTLTPASLATVSPGVAGTAWADWDDPVFVEKEAARVQWVVLASELAAAGMVPGARISQVHFHVQGLYADVPGLGLAVQGGAWTTSTAFVSTGWTATAYPKPSTGQSGSWLLLGLTSTVTWNGTDNLLFDFSRVGGGPGGPYGTLLLRAGLPARMASSHGAASEYPFDDGRVPSSWDAMPELRLCWE